MVQNSDKIYGSEFRQNDFLMINLSFLCQARSCIASDHFTQQMQLSNMRQLLYQNCRKNWWCKFEKRPLK